MSTELVLLTRTASTTARLRASCAAHGLDLVGDLDAGDPLVEVSTRDGVLLLQVFRPRSVTGGGAAAYAEDLGVAAPLDADGRCALTAMSVAGTADEAGLEVVLGVCAALAGTLGGHLVVDGEVVPLEGVPAPKPVSPVGRATSPAAEPAARVFAAAYLSEAAGDADGWHRMIRRVKTLVD